MQNSRIFENYTTNTQLVHLMDMIYMNSIIKEKVISFLTVCNTWGLVHLQHLGWQIKNKKFIFKKFSGYATLTRGQCHRIRANPYSLRLRLNLSSTFRIYIDF